MFVRRATRVWKAFSPEHMKQWWGPKDFTVIASKMDRRPGGTYRYGALDVQSGGFRESA
jgi:uncharacterized protein YndB with AHSA1/START domain